MARLNLTLDPDTWERLGKHATATGQARAAAARHLLRRALSQLEDRERRSALARDYAEGRPDAVELLREHEAGQLDLLDDDD